MQVLIICMSGLTTSILARKLNTYCTQKQINASFDAARIGTLKNVEGYDLLLFAPQTRTIYNRVSKEYSIQSILLQEEMFVQADPEEIMEFINKEIENVDNTEQKDDRVDYKSMIKDILLSCGCVLIICLLFNFLDQIFNNQFSMILNQITYKIISLYFALIIGYYFSKYCHIDSTTCCLLAIASVFLVIPSFASGIGEEVYNESISYFYVNHLSLRYSLLIALVVLISLFTFRFLCKLMHMQIKEYYSLTGNFIGLSIVCGGDFMLLLLIRLSIQLLSNI